MISFRDMVEEDLKNKWYEKLARLELVTEYSVKDSRKFYDPCENCVNKGKVCSCALPAMYNPIWCATGFDV